MSPSLYARFQNEKCMREAAKIAKKGIEAAAEFARPGVLEAEIVGEIERVCRIAGSQFFPHHNYGYFWD